MALVTRFVIAGITAAGLVHAAPHGGKPNHISNIVHQWVKESGQTIEWKSCGEGLPETLTCATFNVPLDWKSCSKSHHKETVELSMVRLEAEDKENRIGNLFINPGGPGGQATNTVAAYAAAGALDAEIRAKFDVIGLDPRGVGKSSPVQCDVEAFNKRIKFRPTTEAEFDALVQYNKDLGASCLEKTGPLLNFVDTISVVKDHEAVRIALGGEKASFLGLSYGTQLFSQYAQFFPDSVRAMILDGALQRSQSEASNILTESTAYEATLKQFFAWCAATEECPLHGQDVEAVFTGVRDKATKTPIPAPGCDDKACYSDLTEEDFLFTAQGFLSSEKAWPIFAEALLQADQGNATIISQTNQIAQGDPYSDSYLFAGRAIACQDWEHASADVSDVVEKETLGAVFSPLTLGICQSYRIQTACIGWPAPLTNKPAPVVYKGKVTMLQVNSLYDPSTSYTWAVGLQSEIKNSVLLTRDGNGHTSYDLGGETTQLMNAYLLNLTLPEPGTVTTS